MAWVRVWPKWQRLLHAGLALTMVAALITYEGGRLHELTSYAAFALVLLPPALGFGGPVLARFSSFVRAPMVTWDSARALWQRREAHHRNHNPLGAWMVVVLLSLGAGAAATGALYVTDRFRGEAWLIAAHALLAWPQDLLVPLHIAGVIHASRRHRENLVGRCGATAASATSLQTAPCRLPKRDSVAGLRIAMTRSSINGVGAATARPDCV